MDVRALPCVNTLAYAYCQLVRAYLFPYKNGVKTGA
jgi:hypothetical protein